MSWYVVKTNARQENRAKTHLENQEYQVYCPWLVKKNGQREALFTGYLFIALEHFAESFASIKNTRGVHSMIRFGDWWATVEQEFIDFLKLKEDGLQCVPLFLPNQDIVFKEGPFKGIEAVYLCANGEERATVLLTLLNRRQTLVVEENLLKAL